MGINIRRNFFRFSYRPLHRALLAAVCLLLVTCKAQQKSTNIQNIAGKKYYIHKIEKKQSLYAIGRMYGVSLDSLYKINPELRNGAKAGQEIRIPYEVAQQPKPAPTDSSRYNWHTVLKGETMYSITRKYNLSEKQLVELNPALQQGLKEGQKIIVGEKGRRKNKELAPVTLTTTPALLPIDSARFIPFSKPVKQHYVFSLILPFRLDEMRALDLQTMLRGNDEFPELPAYSTDFYLGFRKAIDSLSAPGFSVTLQLYDVDDKDSLLPSQMVNNKEFLQSDMVFGPLYESSFKALSQKCMELHVPIVSPFTQQNKILFNNIFVSKTNPSQYTLLENLADYCMDSLLPKRANVVLMTVSARDKREAAYTEAFKQYYNNRLLTKGYTVTDTLRTAKGIEQYKKVYSRDRANVVIALSTNQVFLADFTTQLAMLDTEHNVTLCGWESVTDMDNIDQEYLNQLNYTFPQQFDASKQEIPALDGWYRQQQLTAPTQYYYVGFSIASYYLSNLRNKGPDFIYQLDQLPSETGIMRFRFYRPDMTTGFDNRGTYIFRYNNYKLVKTGWQ